MENSSTTPPANWIETDIPAEWRIPEGVILETLTKEKSDAIELDRR